MLLKSFEPTIPNILTLFRLLLLPFIFCPLFPFASQNFFRLIFSLSMFLLAAFTDFLDGYIARKFNQSTEWGAYMDPLIDKFLVTGMLLVFLFMPFLEIPLWTLLLIIGRDIAVTQMRNYAAENDISFKTSFLAKTKTAVQMIACFLILLYMSLSFFLYNTYNLAGENYFTVWIEIFPMMSHFPKILMIFTSLFTGLTGLDYLVKLRTAEHFS